MTWIRLQPQPPARSRAPLLALVVAAGALLPLGAHSDLERNASPPQSPRMVAPANALLAEDFSSGLDGWQTEHKEYWHVRGGMLRADLPDKKQVHTLIRIGDTTWYDYALDFDVCGMRGVDKGAIIRIVDKLGLGVDLRGPGYNDIRVHLSATPLGRIDVINGNGIWHHIRMEVRDRHCRVLVGNQVLLDRFVSKRLPPGGGIALAAYTGGVGECTVFFDNVVVTPLE
jgi:hypothetical protein